MNEPIHKNCIAERDWLRGEYKRLQAENANIHFLIEQANWALAQLQARIRTSEEVIGQIQRESAELREDRDNWRTDARNRSLRISEMEIELEAHRRFHSKIGCPGGDECYVCAIPEPPATNGDGLGFFPGFPPGFDVKRAEKGLAQSDCVCGHSRGRHITAIQGQPLGKCHAGGCKCPEFQEADTTGHQAEAQGALGER